MMFVYVCLRVGIICRKMASTFLYILRTLPVYNTGTCSGGPRSECFRHTRYTGTFRSSAAAAAQDSSAYRLPQRTSQGS